MFAEYLSEVLTPLNDIQDREVDLSNTTEVHENLTSVTPKELQR